MSHEAPLRKGPLPPPTREHPPYVVVEGSGVLLRPDITRTELAALTGLVDVIQRIEPSAPVRYLTEPEVASLMNLEALAYRAVVEGNDIYHGSSPFPDGNPRSGGKIEAWDSAAC